MFGAFSHKGGDEIIGTSVWKCLNKTGMHVQKGVIPKRKSGEDGLALPQIVGSTIYCAAKRAHHRKREVS